MSDLENDKYNDTYKKVMAGNTAETDQFNDWLSEAYQEGNDDLWYCDGVAYTWSELVDELFSDWYFGEYND